MDSIKSQAADSPVSVDNLTRKFGKKTALANVTLEVPKGCVFGLVGENGAGKTTLIKHLLGLLKAKEGTVRVFGMDPVKEPENALARIGYLSENRDLPNWMRIHELMRYRQAFYPTWDQGYADELVDKLGLDISSKVKTLSRGERARAGLLIALAHRPDLLLLDEPSSGLDPVVRRDILGAIIRTVADEGRTVFFSSHLLDEVERVADIVAMIHNGNVVLCAPLDEIKSNHHRLTLQFPEPQSTKPTMEGALSCEGSGDEWTIVCNGKLEEIRQSANNMGAKIIEEEVPSLEDIFVARVKGN